MMPAENEFFGASDIAATNATAERYFLDCDDSCHVYLIPISRRAEWQAWMATIEVDTSKLSNDELDAINWDAPEFAKRIDGWHSISFTNPEPL